MIAGLSKAVNLYLAPVLSLTALLLALFAYLAPTVLLHTQVALLVVSPSLSLTQPGATQGVDGPSVFFGALGSCARPNNEASVNCTAPMINPTYDLSVLPGDAPDLLSAPTATTPAFIAVSLAFTITFFLLFSLMSFRGSMGKFGATFEKPLMHRVTAWIGLLGFMIGLTSFLVIRMWFGKAVEDFNDDIARAGSGAPQLIAATSNGFIMVWVAYAFYAVPLVSSLANLHMKSASDSGKA
ncbi:hypothetical protein CERSUDRAFT_110562 [Gelatoporia subvermispora B]|uniref:Uncharacterized protein n=1 Tax=Ceriporiopsis subvermispora (strain B) TaxID=914234 RepID=M2QY18_CERS8|nr:hypothetical protein CERSUDRAFT_110562 [Gelatoporia subvermispora B]